jgi:hypothetical protein
MKTTSPGVTKTIAITGNGFTSSTTVNINIKSPPVTILSSTYQSPQLITASISIDPAAFEGVVPVTVDRNGATSNSISFGIRVPHHLKVISDQSGLLASNCAASGLQTPVLRQVALEVVNAGNFPVGKTSVKETFVNTSTNTCRADGLGPIPEPCGDTDLDSLHGRFIDSITVNCNSVGGSCGYIITDEWKWCPAGREKRVASYRCSNSSQN